MLPVTARDEEWQPTTQESMFNYVRMSDGGITRLADVRPEVAILADLGLRLFGDGQVDFAAFKSHRHIRQAIARIVPGMQDLADIDVARQEFHIRGRLLHTPAFKTADGRACFQVRAMPDPAPQPDAGARRLTLTTVRSEGQFNTIIYEQKDSYRGLDDRWTVMMNAEDIAAFGLSAGNRVTLASEFGRMDAVTVQPFDLPRGDAMAYFPEANVLTGTAVDPRSKTPSFKATPVWIETGAPGGSVSRLPPC